MFSLKILEKKLDDYQKSKREINKRKTKKSTSEPSESGNLFIPTKAYLPSESSYYNKGETEEFQDENNFYHKRYEKYKKSKKKQTENKGKIFDTKQYKSDDLILHKPLSKRIDIKNKKISNKIKKKKNKNSEDPNLSKAESKEFECKSQNIILPQTLPINQVKKKRKRSNNKEKKENSKDPNVSKEEKKKTESKSDHLNLPTSLPINLETKKNKTSTKNKKKKISKDNVSKVETIELEASSTLTPSNKSLLISTTPASFDSSSNKVPDLVDDFTASMSLTGFSHQAHEELNYNMEENIESNVTNMGDATLEENDANIEDDQCTTPSSTKFIDLVSSSSNFDSLYITKDKKPYIDAKSFKNKSLTVALFCDSKICIKGNYCLKLILGSINVMGYKFKEGEEHVIYSPGNHSSLPINVLAGAPIMQFNGDQLNFFGISVNWVQKFNVHIDEAIALIELKEYKSNMTRLFETPFFRNYNLCLQPSTKKTDFTDTLWREEVGVEFLNSKNDKVFNAPNEWSQYLEAAAEEFKRSREMRVVVCGGKNVGKSSFIRYAINSLLSDPSINEVACLDLDPGQPEFSLSACLSLVVIKSPVLGAPPSHWEQNLYSYERRISLGEIAVNNILSEYLHIVTVLMEEFRYFNKPMPLIVNTMGYTSNIGVDIIVDVLRIVRPTSVVTILSPKSGMNFNLSLDCYTVMNINRGILNLFTKLNYELIVFNSQVLRMGSEHSKQFRNINTLSYLSKLWRNDVNMVPENCNAPVKIRWNKVAIHVQGSYVPPNYVLQSINGSFVSLCYLNPEHLSTYDYNLPLQIQNYNGWVTSNHCIGWGIVKGIDPHQMEIIILTPLDPITVSNNVNVIALSKIFLPQEMHHMFNKGVVSAPYVQKYIQR